MKLYTLKVTQFDIPAGVMFYPVRDINPEGEVEIRYKTDYPSKYVLSWWIEPDEIASSPLFEDIGHPNEYSEVRVNLKNRIKGHL